MLAKPKSVKVPVTMRALIQRINRKIAVDDLVLKVARGRERDNLGDYYILNTRYNVVQGWKNLDPELYGRDIGALRDWEEVR